MKIEFTGRNFTVSPAIKKHVTEHFRKIETVLSEAVNAHVILSVEKHHRNVVEIVVHWKDRSLTSKTDATDMYVAATQAVEKIRSQAVRVKGKIIDRHQAVRATGRGRQAAVVPAAPPVKSAAKGEAVEPRIIRSRKHAVKPMTPDEAVLILAEVKDPFVVFQNADSGRVSIVFRRKDGNFGLIEA